MKLLLKIMFLLMLLITSMALIYTGKLVLMFLGIILFKGGLFLTVTKK